MPSLTRALAGQPLLFHLASESAELEEADVLARSGRSARTLAKDGPLRVTLIALAAGGSLASHHAEGPITVHVLSGSIRFSAEERAWEMHPGDVLALPSGVEHAVTSGAGGTFLVTVARGG